MVYRFNIPIFGAPFSFYMGESERKKFLKNTGIKEDQDDGKWKTAYGIAKFTAVFLSNWEDLSLAVHEIYHAVVAMCEFAGIDDEETTAYLLGYIFEKYLKYYNTNMAKKKAKKPAVVKRKEKKKDGKASEQPV